jgi:hypothetical protein
MPDWSENSGASSGEEAEFFEDPPKTEEENDQDRDDMTGKIAQDYMKHDEERGIGQGKSWGKWSQERLGTGVVNWEEYLVRALRGYLSKPGMQDYSYSRPSRRTRHLGIILPSLRAADKNVVCIVDVSGSVSRAELIAALSEAGGVIVSAGKPITLIACDQNQTMFENVRDIDAIQDEIPYGGGTDLRVAYYKIQNENIRADYIICFTDGETPWPGHGGGSDDPQWIQDLEVPECDNIVVCISEEGRHADTRNASLTRFGETDFDPEWLDVTVTLTDEQRKQYNPSGI